MVSKADEMFADLYPLDQRFFGVEISIKRSTSITSDVPAISFTTDNQTIDEDTGVPVIYRTRDFIIEKENYKINDVAVSPALHDVLVEIIEGTERAFEVLPVQVPSSSRVLPAFEDEHSDGTRWLIRTKEVYE